MSFEKHRHRPATRSGYTKPVIACRVFGHRARFVAQATTMRWWCERGCGWEGRKTYARAEDARRYARAFDREDRDDIGRRAPLLGMFPLRIGRALMRRRARPAGRDRDT